MRIREVDPKADAINRARANLLFELRRAVDKPGANKADLIKAINEFVFADIEDSPMTPLPTPTQRDIGR